MMECRRHISRIAIIAFVMLFLSSIYWYQSTNNGETLPEDLGSLISSERDEGVTYITKQNEDTLSYFQDGDKLIAATENAHCVSKPAAVATCNIQACTHSHKCAKILATCKHKPCKVP